MYNDFIDTICQEINDHFHELTQDEVRTLIWRLGSFVEGKKQSPEFKEKVASFLKEFDLDFPKL